MTEYVWRRLGDRPQGVAHALFPSRRGGLSLVSGCGRQPGYFDGWVNDPAARHCKQCQASLRVDAEYREMAERSGGAS
jgi:hypothetical protein